MPSLLSGRYSAAKVRKKMYVSAIESIALPILDLYLHPVYQIGRKIR